MTTSAVFNCARYFARSAGGPTYATDVKNVIDNSRQLGALAIDNVDDFLVGRRVFARHLQHVHGIADGRERVAQFMRENCYELIDLFRCVFQVL